MAVNYDLVILGGTAEGYEAARHASQLGARVAWVLNSQAGRRSPSLTLGFLKMASAISPQVSERHSSWRQCRQQARLIAETLTNEDLQQIAVQGVDVIAEVGELVAVVPLLIETPTRRLTTRAALLATGNVPSIPLIFGIDTVPYETPETFLKRDKLPESVVILGSDASGLQLSQMLKHWGISVTLVTPNITLLNREDPAVSQWMMAQLRATGIDLRLGVTVNTVTVKDDAFIVESPQETLEVEALVVAAAPISNLASLGAKAELTINNALLVNSYLQTRYPRVYACGSVIGGYELTAIAHQEARIAVENALFWHRRRIDYCTIPYGLAMQPEIARVGLTEPEAQKRYGVNKVLVTRQTLYENFKAQWYQSTSGFCKIIAHRDGQILGVHGVGPEASEWVQTIAMLMKCRVPWWAIADFPTLPHSLTDTLRQATQQWEGDRWQPGQWRRDWAENWFNWRRSR